MKKLLTVLLVAMMALTLAACGEKEAVVTEDKKVLNVAFGGGTPLYMDPALNSASNGSNIIHISHAGLMGYNGNGELVPELAEKYEVSPDGMTYTFTLRSGLKWSDGSDFYASDIAKSWNRAASETLGADYGFLYEVIKGYDAGELEVVADDAAGTVVVNLAFAAPYFLDLCGFPTFFPVKTDIADAEGVWAVSPETNVGMGAFKVVEVKPDDVIVYEKNEYYWNAANVELDGVNCYLSEDDTAMLTNYENGTYHFLNSVNPTEFARLTASYPDEFKIADQMGTWYVLFNVHKDMSPVGGKQLTVQEQSVARQALGMFVNRVELVENITQGGQAPATGFFPAGLSDGLNSDVRSAAGYGSWYTGTNTPSSVNAAYTEDQVKACEMLMDLGYSYTGTLAEGNLKFTDVPAVEFAFNNSGANKAIIEYVQEVWNTFGIQAIINQDAWSTLQQELKAGNAEAARMGWVADYNDVTNFIEIFISSSGNNYPRLGRDLGTYTKASAVTQDAGKGAYWGLEGNQTWDEAFDALDTAIKYETDMAKRAALSAEAEQVLMATGGVAPMYFYTNPYIQKTNLTNVVVLVSGDIVLTYAHLD